MTHLSRTVAKLIPGLQSDLSKAMAASSRIKFNMKQSQKVYSFETAPITDGPLGQSIQSASPLRSINQGTSKGLFQ